MDKKIIILITILLIPIVATQAYANDINLGDALVVKENSDKKKQTMKSDIDKQFAPHDDLTISDGASAGLISGPAQNSMTSNSRISPEGKKDETRVGVGLSLSF
ncbi:hypothetical protein [Maridesulfovibrio frigidus]|uniref:hypothetical protein n=1 Tax=Maridesulfovibrio frigidus TaxID=340956 RepID=UPI0004E24412|nr:hypothetical protein [Maridesulfovibrio frigidus]